MGGARAINKGEASLGRSLTSNVSTEAAKQLSIRQCR
jgi:hypothetical protein